MLQKLTVMLSFILFALPSVAAEDASNGLSAELTVEHGRDDNIFSSDLVEESSTITTIAPNLVYRVGSSDESHFSLQYQGEFARYWDSRDDDYEDHRFGLTFARRANDFFRLSADAGIAKGHDNRGEGSSEGAAVISRSAPDEFDETDAGIELDLGREDARFGLNLRARLLDIEYTNNKEQASFRDRKDQAMEGRLYARLAPKTRAYAAIRQVDIEYDQRLANGDTLDSDEQTVALGIEWEVTGKLTGSIEAGRQEKDFDSAAIGEEDFTSWDVSITWTPRTYSTIVLTSSRDSDETNGTGAFAEKQDYGISWIHAWSDRLQSVFSAGIGDDEYPGSFRQDDRTRYEVGLDYDWRHWLKVGLRLEQSERDSNSDVLDYDRRKALLVIGVSF